MKKSDLILGVSLLSIAAIAWAQGRGGGGWSTARADAQRTAWEHDNGYISLELIGKGGFALQWKRKLDNAPRQLNSLTDIAAAPGSGLNPPPTVIGGSSNNVYGIDDDTGGVSWKHHFNAALPAGGTLACPGGLTASVSRPTSLTQQVSTSVQRGLGRGRGPAQGAVGEPGEGVPMAMMQGGMFGPGGGGPGGFAGGRGGSGGRGPGGPGGFADFGGGPGGRGASGGRGRGFGGPGRGTPQGTYAVASDGMLHELGQAEGKDIEKPVRFLPANANVTDMIAVNQILYAATTNGCGGAPNGVWAIDLASPEKTVVSWKSAASPVGAPALSSRGTVYIATADGSVTALDPKTLAVKDSFHAAGAAFSSTPTIFSYKDHELVAVAAKDGRVFLLDADALGTPLSVSAATTTNKNYAPAAMATWEDINDGTRWLLVPAMGAKSNVIAFKVTGEAAKPSLQQEWTTRDLVTPAPPIVVNGLVFALSSGEYTPASGTPTLAEKISKSVPAVLYVYDGGSGKEVWNSASAITSFMHSGGLWSSGGQVYVPTHDSTIYAFGFAMERHM
ncbi:MAG TPA: PQQ-binding-like beta-propeller repeat protein [Bryobacteraceae bacterium]|nr:PQQ-binding-like beta-propeller repeat protein [Bryobacteraceae bacterium]